MALPFPNRENGGGVISSIAKVSLGMIILFTFLWPSPAQAQINACGDCQSGFTPPPGLLPIGPSTVLGNSQTSSSFTLTTGNANIGTSSDYSVGFGENIDIELSKSYARGDDIEMLPGDGFHYGSGQKLTFQGGNGFKYMWGAALLMPSGPSFSYLLGNGDIGGAPLTLNQSQAFAIGFDNEIPEFIVRENPNPTPPGAPVAPDLHAGINTNAPNSAAALEVRDGLLTQVSSGAVVPGGGVWNSLGRSPSSTPINAFSVNGTRSQWGDFAFLSGVEDPNNGTNGGSAFIGWAEENTSNPDQRLRIGPIEGNNFLERMTVLYNGNVGIETATPDRELQVAGNTRIDESLSVGDNGAASGAAGVLEVGSGNTASSDNSAAMGENNTVSSISGPPSFAWGTGNGVDSDNSTAMGSGNIIDRGVRNTALGAGHTLSASENVVAGGIGIDMSLGGNTNCFVYGNEITYDAGVFNAHAFGGGGGTIMQIQQNNSFSIGYNTTLPQFIVRENPTGAGNIQTGIGTDNPDATLDVVRDVPATSTDKLFEVDNPGLANRPAFLVRADGFVGIGRTAPLALTQNPISTPTGTAPQAANEVLSVAGTIVGAGYGVQSDRKWKKNIEVLEQPLAVLHQLNGYRYEYRTEEFPEHNFGERPTYGLIAQEVDKVFPYAVWHGEEGMLVNYDAMVPLFVEAIKEQQDSLQEARNINQAQQKEISQLREQTSRQQAMLERMEARLAALEENQGSDKGSGQTESGGDNQRRVDFPENGQQARLYPAEPNPFGQETRIRYFLPEGFQEAQIRIFDANGRSIKSVDLREAGNGALVVEAGGLRSGTYVYELIVDGAQVDRYRMVRISNY